MRPSRKAAYQMLKDRGQRVQPETLANMSDEDVKKLCEDLWKDQQETSRKLLQEQENAALVESSQKHVAEAARSLERASSELGKATRILNRVNVRRSDSGFARYSQVRDLVLRMTSGLARAIGPSRRMKLDLSDPDLAMEDVE